MYLTMALEALSRLPVFRWNGAPDSQDWICAVVCRNWASSAGYSACTRAVASAAAPASTMMAPSRVHQVAASGGQPRRLSRAARGCSSAVSSSAAAHGTTTTYSTAATRAMMYSAPARSRIRHAQAAAARSHRGTSPDTGGPAPPGTRPSAAGAIAGPLSAAPLLAMLLLATLPTELPSAARS